MSVRPLSNRTPAIGAAPMDPLFVFSLVVLAILMRLTR
jgi:hypothetical protein